MNPKIKSENYSNFGGIDSKASPYITGPMEFLDLQNLDFQTPGSLSMRWGSTMYVGQTFSANISSLFEFTRVNGASYVMMSHTGGLWFGATTGVSQGASLVGTGATSQHWGAVNWMTINPPNPSGSNYAGVGCLGAYYLGSTASPIYGFGVDPFVGYTAKGNTFVIDSKAPNLSNNQFSFAVLDNWLFLADGNKFLKFDGSTFYPVGLPPALWATNGLTDFHGNVSTDKGFGVVTGSTTTLTQIGFQYGPSLGTYYLFASYVNNRGFEGPVWPFLAVAGNNQYNETTVITLGAGSTGLLQASLAIATPLQFGISAIKIYSFYEPYNSAVGQTYSGQDTNNVFSHSMQQRYWNIGPPVIMQTILPNGSSFVSSAIGSTNQADLQSNIIGTIESTNPNLYLPIGITVAAGPSLPPSVVQYAGLFNESPAYLEVYQNRLFLAGFSASPSTFWYSDIGEPEGYAPDWNYEVRTNDGDVITAMKSYQTRLLFFKNNSFHLLSGDSPENFFLQQISDQYGCLNNRCVVTFENSAVFLDRKGIILWNGANISVLSSKIQPLFDRLNVSVAKTTACAVHDKLRNQVIFSVPLDSATSNNYTLVYDYLTGAWTRYSGITMASLAAIQGRNTTKHAFFGDNLGRVNWFGSSFLSDNGVGFTTYIKTRFLHDMGESVQKMFRRLFLNTDSPSSSTLSFSVNFYQDYGSTIVLGASIVLSQFQNRIDFGISAKSVAFELSNMQTSLPLRIHGFTIESRFLRRV